VDVRVVQAWDHGLADQFHDLRARAGVGLEAGAVADVDEAASLTAIADALLHALSTV
jgi:hypothetical protein